MSPAQRLADLEAALTAAGLEPATYARLLTRVRAYLRRYAALERSLLGGIQVAVPRHLLDSGGEDDAPDSEGDLGPVESLAQHERKRLDFGGLAGRDVMTILDHEGQKVYRPLFPEGGLRGFFLFDEEIGPAFVADGRLPHPTSNAVFARLYGHYLLDHDPYEIRLVVAGDTARGARALRGEHFAVAFLIGKQELIEFLTALEWKPPRRVDARLLEQLTVYFEADVETVVGRLLSLGLVEAADVPDLLPTPEATAEVALEEAAETLEETAETLEETAESLEETAETLEETAVGERYVRLALEAHARGQITEKELARHLETDLRSARRLAGQFEVGALDPEGGGS